MSLYMILGMALALLGSIQMTPWFRRKAIKRGFSGWIGIPFIFVLIGFLTFMVSFFGWL